MVHTISKAGKFFNPLKAWTDWNCLSNISAWLKELQDPYNGKAKLFSYMLQYPASPASSLLPMKTFCSYGYYEIPIKIVFSKVLNNIKEFRNNVDFIIRTVTILDKLNLHLIISKQMRNIGFVLTMVDHLLVQ